MKTNPRILLPALSIGLVVAVAVVMLAGRQQFADGPESTVPVVPTTLAVPLRQALDVKMARTPVRAATRLADSDGIGPCPKSHSPVIRRGLDADRQPTWWHADGSLTVRVKQIYTLGDQQQVFHSTVLIRPVAAAAK